MIQATTGTQAAPVLPSPSPLSLTVILPTYNERENIPILIAGILASVQTPVRVLSLMTTRPNGTWQVVRDIAHENHTFGCCTGPPSAASRRPSGRHPGGRYRCRLLDGLRSGDAAGDDPAVAGSPERGGRHRNRVALCARWQGCRPQLHGPCLFGDHQHLRVALAGLGRCATTPAGL